MRLTRAFSAVHTRVSFSFDLTFTPLPVAHSLSLTHTASRAIEQSLLLDYVLNTGIHEELIHEDGFRRR